MARAVAVLLLLVLSVSVVASAKDMSIISYNKEHGTRGLERTDAEVRAMYNLWLAEHGRNANGRLGGGEEYEHCFRLFQDNLRFFDTHNAREEGFHLAMNRFADLTNDEFRAAYLGVKGDMRACNVVRERYRHNSIEELPAAVD